MVCEIGSLACGVGWEPKGIDDVSTVPAFSEACVAVGDRVGVVVGVETSFGVGSRFNAASAAKTC